MNNIEILEYFIKKQKSNKGTFVPTDFEITALENLIQENKELSWKYENAKDMYIIKDNSINENYIPKSKVKEIKEKIHNLLDNNGITRAYQLEIDKYFEDLEEGE